MQKDAAWATEPEGSEQPAVNKGICVAQTASMKSLKEDKHRIGRLALKRKPTKLGEKLPTFKKGKGCLNWRTVAVSGLAPRELYVGAVNI